MSKTSSDHDLIAQVLNVSIEALTPLSGGCIARVYKVCCEQGPFVAKVSPSGEPSLTIEASMLRDLRRACTLPVPEVIASTDSVLVMEFIEAGGGPSSSGGVDLARGLAQLHSIKGQSFGYEHDTLIGPLHQPNTPDSNWPGFYASRRIEHFAAVARDRGQLSVDLFERCLQVAVHLEDWIENDEPPALIHGDLWAGNVLWNDGSVAALIDPAVHYAHREVELAFMDLFGSFPQSFWDEYQRLKPITDGFWQQRRHLYRIYPLLVHTALFGGSYSAMLSGELDFFAQGR